MTTRELRHMLFAIDNQDLTIHELRQILFSVHLQDKELTNEEIRILTK